ncbi:MAG: hypothetical protein WD070_00595, partial [Pirellulaceae bacterium]
ENAQQQLLHELEPFYQARRWLGKTSLAKYVALRRPVVPPHNGTKISFDAWPAELNTTMKSVDGRFDLALVYEISIPGDGKAMSRDDKKKWKAAVEEDAHELFLRLTQLLENT